MRYIDWILRRIEILRNSNILDFPHEKHIVCKVSPKKSLVNSLYTTGIAKVGKNMIPCSTKLATFLPKRRT
jgi:hypothetical protein